MEFLWTCHDTDIFISKILKLRHDGARFFRNILLLSWLIQIMNPWVQNCIIFLKTINDRVSNSSFSILLKTWLFTPQNHRKIRCKQTLSSIDVAKSNLGWFLLILIFRPLSPMIHRLLLRSSRHLRFSNYNSKYHFLQPICSMDVDCFGLDSRCLLVVSKYVCSSLTKVSLETRIQKSVISDWRGKESKINIHGNIKSTLWIS